MTDTIKILPADQIASFVDALLKDHRVYAPTEADGVLRFDWVETGQTVTLTERVPRTSPKEALLPRTEVLFYYQTGKDTEQVIPPPAPQPQVLFGLHPADLAAVKVLDAVFSAEPYPDKPYLDRRDATILVGLGYDPAAKADACFCDAVGISTMQPGDADLFLTRLDDERFALEVLTDKASRLAEAYGNLDDADEAARNQLTEQRRRAEQAVTNTFDVAALSEKLDTMFDSDFWQSIAHQCVGCGACAYLCPTCHCFDISEETRGGCGARVRNWDTCQFEVFTRHASGHNPRDEQAPRCRQRIMHKFNYGWKNFNLPFCVGCGRCIVACPGGNDIRNVLKRIEDES